MRHVRVILLCSLFLLPFCHPSARNSCVEQNSVGDNVLKEQDTLCIETEETESEIIYRLCFGGQDKRKVVFELQTADGSSIDFVQSYKSKGTRKFDCFALYNNATYCQVNFYALLALFAGLLITLTRPADPSVRFLGHVLAQGSMAIGLGNYVLWKRWYTRWKRKRVK